ncbi:Tafazzin [Thalictrum thalictroides]|uniref:Tafazzin n=1 Tax=Thalictrum thalictroides TaxID=46969 RepID=A0A7J6WMW6_THATH|nr:Tafazzin [Thalictrum thalictroides]
MNEVKESMEWIDGRGGGDVWKNKVRSLQLRIRDRFRVTVDKHRIRNSFKQRISDGYFSSTMQTWILRFRYLRRDSLPPSPSAAAYAFYRKRVAKDIDTTEDSILMRMLQAVAVPVIGNVCHVFMHGLNRVQVYGAEKLEKALLHRPEGKPLITVSNHVASVDDPFVIASLLPPSVLLDGRNLRWTLCATDRCFKNTVTSAFFRSVKVLPVSRGDGIYQKGMDIALSKLNSGGWVHIFPEGSRSRDGGRTMGSTKRGVGRLVIDADIAPMVLPFVHSGMQEIMPVGSNFPKIGKTVTVLIGDPIHLDDLVDADNDKFIPRGELYDAISSRIGQRLQDLKVKVDRLAHEQAMIAQDSRNGDRATGILQQVDWEAFGMGSYILSDNESSLTKVVENPQKLNSDYAEQPTSDLYFRVSFSYEGGIMSRIRGYMHPTELMGFAARGLFMNTRCRNNNQDNVDEIGPLKVWKQFSEASTFAQWHCR